ncbi:NAD(P)/FAD-dependent oxidoreductase [Synechocystis salina]|uniref:FAD-binding oxidoreductase n=1 Tax=Synechocystis salina LEGE 00031 TaxID=1828736 RepID=A0ABR9VNC7_9SYNC|nr:FAD-dependent oxidoreductase [Synechocystis salina]MBE9240425.1 FAD-binding oxidoreductase [Synechocystis salina LEGE 00041]MBE9252847.1 FAD-binding oxidoreductase [Synechocystis salina LEGE 00031]
MPKVAIVGAGVVGATIAYELSGLPGLTIDLFDAQAPAQGATGAALGILMAVISQKTKGRGWRLREQSLQRYRTLLPELEAATGKTIPGDRQGLVKILLEEDWSRWQQLQTVRRSQGYPLELWTRAEVEQKLSGWSLDYEAMAGAIYSPWDWQIQPQALTQSLIEAAQQRGVRCHFQQTVHSLPPATVSKHCQSLPTSQDDFPVDYVIVTAGLGSDPLVGTANGKNPLLQLQPVIGQAFLLQFADAYNPLHHSPWRSVLTTEDIHLVPLANGQFWLGATVEFPADCPSGEPNTELREKLWQQAIAYYPFLERAEIINYWSGKRPRPVGESAPVIRPLDGYDNVLLATGHHRNGVLLAPGTAQEVKTWLKAKLT